MPAQSDLEKEFEAAVFDDESKGATLRTKNLETDRYHRPVITSRGRKSQVKAFVTLTTCVHGYLNSKDKTQASLIGLRYEFRDIQKGTRLESIYTELEFSNETPTSLMEEPHIINYAPFKEPGKDHKTASQVETQRAAMLESVGGGAMGASAEVSGRVGIATKQSYELQYFQLLQASVEMSKQIGPGPNVVWWNMEASEDPGAGADRVPPTLCVAALVQRKNDAKFKANFKLSIKAGISYAATEAWKEFWRIGRDDPILFDPAAKRIGGDGFDENNLQKFAEENGMLEVAFYRNLKNFD